MRHWLRFPKTAAALAFAACLPVCLPAKAGAPVEIANTQDDFSTTQGLNGFTHGYYDWGDGGVFKLLPLYNDTHYRFLIQPPYSEIGKATPNQGYPNGANSAPGVEHWVVRRYTAEEAGKAIIKWYLYHLAILGSDGVTGKIYHNGQQIDSHTMLSGRVERWVSAELEDGDLIDFVLTPQGPDGSSDDSDRSYFGGIVAIYGEEIRPSFADSQKDFGGTQCLNGWQYGIYNTTDNGPPDAGGGDFIPFPNDGALESADNYWTGVGWSFPIDSRNPPWTTIYELSGHPNGENNVKEHWATRRFTVQPTDAGDLVADWTLSKSNTNGGMGTSVSVLHNGEELDKATVGGMDAFGVRPSTVIPMTRAGDWIDLALTPEGVGNDRNDGLDGSWFSMTLRHLDMDAIRVDRTDDEATASDCTPAPFDCSLRGAVIAANAVPGNSTVILPAGRYMLTDSSAGPIRATQPLTVIGAGPWRTVIDAGQLGNHIFDADQGLSLRGLGLTGGSDESVSASGSGVARVTGNFELSNCDVYGNHVTKGAGGAFTLSGGNSIIAGSTIRDNSAQVGGGVLSLSGNLRIWNSTISGNRASELGGGVVVYGGSVNLTHATFARNQAPAGDALSFGDGAVGSSINSLVEGNCGFFSAAPGITSMGGNVGQPGVNCQFNHSSDLITGGATGLAGLLTGGPFPPAFPLLASSAAVDTGVIGAKLCAVTDQLGAPRYADGNDETGAHYDAGATERAHFRVTMTDDGFPINDAHCEGICTLRSAIHNANLRPGPDLIELPPGLYLLNLAGADEDNTQTGDLDILDDVEIRGSDAGTTIIDGDLADRIFHVAGGVQATFTQLTIRNGLAGTAGGGIRQESASTVRLTRSILSGNAALTGGGGGVFTDGQLVVDASTLSGNTAAGGGASGGGIYVGAEATVEIINSTLDGNSAETGAGVYNSGVMGAYNVTVSGGTGALGTALRHASNASFFGANVMVSGSCLSSGSASVNSFGGNLEGPGNSCGFNHTSDQANLADLKLGPLANNGGPTPTRSLLEGSPAIDAGVSLGCLPFGQRGIPRPADGDRDGIAHCDSGAFEESSHIFSSSFEN